MHKTYLKIALRVFSRNKGFTFINLLGLTLGITSFLVILSFVYHEFSYDQFVEEEENVFRIVQQMKNPEEGMAVSGAALAPVVVQDITAIESFCRLHRQNSFITVKQANSEQIYEEENLMFADSTFFDIFDLPLIEGSPENALNSPGSVVLTETLARKYFGEADPLNQTIELRDQPLQVRAVIEDLPRKTHLKIDMLVSMETFKELNGVTGEFSSYWWPAVWTYVKLYPGANPEYINRQLPELIKNYRDADMAANYVPQLQAIKNIHLYSDYYSEMKANANIDMVYLFAFVGILILLIACINYMNLSIVHASRRAKEIGIRKVNGARHSSLVVRFMSESLLYTAFAIVLSLIAMQAVLPFFGDFIQRELSFNDDNLIIYSVLPLLLLTALLAGYYPSLFVTRFGVVKALKAQAGSFKGKGNWLYRGLVVFQFAASIVLITATLVTYGQLEFMRKASLGFDKEHILSLRVPRLADGILSDKKAEKLENIEKSLSQLSQVETVVTADLRPGFGHGSGHLFEIGGIASSEDDGDRIDRMAVGYDYFRMLNIDIVAGRNFDDRLSTEAESIIVNEALLDKLNISDPKEILGQEIRTYVRGGNSIYGERKGTVVGVVEDFHAASLRRKIEPILFMPGEDFYKASAGTFLVKTTEGADVQALLARLQENWKNYYPENTFDASFLDESLEMRYRSETRLGNMMLIFSILAIVIASLGLYGLAAYLMERKTKEIGIRKVMGARSAELVLQFNKDFVLLLLIAILIAIPLSVYWSNNWLEQFAYRIEPGALWYLSAGGICLLIALLTVSYKAFSAAGLNPAKALRDE
jgi:putative ABC transport system permease protein